MTGSKRAHFAPVLAILALGIVGLTAPRAHASDICPSDVALCVVINSSATTNDRDDVITLPEALLIANGDLSVADLTSEEQGQVVLVPPGWGPNEDGEPPNFPNTPGSGGSGGIGGTRIYFDTDVFCDTCTTKTIVLTPPGFGGPGGIGGNQALPPVGDWSATPVLLGMGYRDGAEVPVSVTLDGSRLDSSTVGLTAIGHATWVRGLTLTGFSGAAIELLSDGILLGSNYDGILDVAEAVTYRNNVVNVLRR